MLALLQNSVHMGRFIGSAVETYPSRVLSKSYKAAQYSSAARELPHTAVFDDMKAVGDQKC